MRATPRRTIQRVEAFGRPALRTSHNVATHTGDSATSFSTPGYHEVQNWRRFFKGSFPFFNSCAFPLMWFVSECVHIVPFGVCRAEVLWMVPSSGEPIRMPNPYKSRRNTQ